MKNELRIERNANTFEYGVFEETGRLRKVMMWGQPGPETIIAQILPKEISCFLEDFSVQQARDEYVRAVKAIKDEGVEIIQVKKLYAQMIEEKNITPNITLKELKDALMQKALLFSQQYPKGNTSEIECIEEMIDQDCAEYGERAAIVMNQRLSLSTELPLANIMYTRDQSNVAGNVWVWSSMRHDIRQPEVSLYKEILSYAGIVTESNFKEIVEVTGSGRFEGGDGIANGGFYYIGIGGRTNWEGVQQVAPAILRQGLRLVVFRDEARDQGANEMDTMHLDTLWMPSEVNTVVSCDIETGARTAIEIVQEGYNLKIKSETKMDDYIKAQGIKVIPLSKKEQKAFAPNFLNIGNGTIILSIVDENSVNRLKGEKTIDKRLSESGKKVVNADIHAIVGGYGGVHCMTASIKRDY